jgi:TolB protein
MLLTQRGLGGGNVFGAWAALAPDEQTIVFAAPNAEPTPEAGVCALFRINVNGSDRKQLTFGTTYDGQPSVAPDGKSIAFISEQKGPSKVFLMNADGSGIRQLTQGTFNDSVPILSRNGSKVFFVRRVSENPDALRHDEIFSVDVDGQNERRLTDNKLMDAPVAEGRDGSLYYLSGSDRFDLMKLDLENGEGRRVLALGRRGSAGCDISPDEKWVAFVSDADKAFEYEVFVCDLEGGNRRRVTNFRGYIEQVRFTPDGKHVIFVVQPKRARENGRGDIYIAPLDGREPKKIGPNG